MQVYTELAKTMSSLIKDLHKGLYEKPVRKSYWYPSKYYGPGEWEELLKDMIEAFNLMSEGRKDVKANKKIKKGVNAFGCFGYYFMSTFDGDSVNQFIGYSRVEALLAQYLYHMLFFYKENFKEYPAMCFSQDWNKIVDIMLEGFNYMANDTCVEEHNYRKEQAVGFFKQYCFYIFDCYM